jgi:autotransporter adhesin
MKRLLLATLVAGTLVAACGDDDDSAESGSDSTTTEATADASSVTVTADEYSFELSATPTADTEEVVFDNVGEKLHVMIFAKINEGFTVEEAIELQGEKGSAEVVAEAQAKPGKQSVAPVEGPIDPGEYAMLCPIEDADGAHYELGQLQEFSIE